VDRCWGRRGKVARLRFEEGGGGELKIPVGVVFDYYYVVFTAYGIEVFSSLY